ncbi:ribosome recycling factor [Candidatus Fermentibacteria bacterium]|nr:ribosome recycling factor [Candidatus Fermentibacteria bacterium]
MIDSLLEELRQNLRKSVKSTAHQMAVVRTGKASPALLEGIRVECWGERLPLKQVAGVSAPEPSLLVIQPYDQNTAQDVAKAIEASDLGLRANVDGGIVRIPIPKLSDERREELVRQVRKMAEDGKTAIRNIRRDANDSLKSASNGSEITEDQEYRAMERVQKVVDESIEEIDKILAAKEREIREV